MALSPREVARRRVVLAAGGAALLAWGLPSCSFAPGDYIEGDAPTWQPALAAPRKRPAVAVVLGGGGPRGFAHIGVLKAFEAAGLEPELIVGASVGAMIGALYAERVPASELEKIALDLNVTDFLRLGGDRGLTGDPRAVERFVAERLPGKRIETLSRRFAATAVEMPANRLAVFNSGNIGVAVRASAALPGTFPPARIRGVEYVDGDELAPVPCEAARQLGADIVIAVDVSAHLSSTPPQAPQEWRVRDQRRSAAIARDLKFADVHVHPDLGYYADVRDAYRRRCIGTGEATAAAAMPKILAAIAAKSNPA